MVDLDKGDAALSTPQQLPQQPTPQDTPYESSQPSTAQLTPQWSTAQLTPQWSTPQLTPQLTPQQLPYPVYFPIPYPVYTIVPNPSPLPIISPFSIEAENYIESTTSLDFETSPRRNSVFPWMVDQIEIRADKTYSAKFYSVMLMTAFELGYKNIEFKSDQLKLANAILKRESFVAGYTRPDYDSGSDGGDSDGLCSGLLEGGEADANEADLGITVELAFDNF